MKKTLVLALLLCGTKLYAQQITTLPKSSENRTILVVVQLDDKSFEANG